MLSAFRTGSPTICRTGVAIGAILTGVLMCSQAMAADAPTPDPEYYVDNSQPVELLQELMQETPTATSQERLWIATPERSSDWTIDYRCRTLCSSTTSYEFGTGPGEVPVYSPISRLDFPINSCWHGLQVGVERPTWGVHCEWLMPQQGIQGELADFDWRVPDASFTDLGLAQERWTEGQMLDLGLEFQLTKRFFGLPIEVWPTGGFRWQRLNIMCYDLRQYESNGRWHDPPITELGNIISFNQQYYVCYIGGQLRTELNFKRLPPVLLTFQGDWGSTEAYNVDHHLIREGDRYTLETTHGGSWHVSLTAEAPLTKRLSLGFQADHLEIRTTGKHHFLNVPEGTDETWYNGVSVSSDQTWLTAFVRLRI